jgi:hypothetical protein
MIPVLSEIFGAGVALVVGVVCVREIVRSELSLDLLLLAVLSFALVPVLVRRALRIARELRAGVNKRDH